MTWVLRILGAAGLLVVAWVCLTEWSAVVHGHALYAVFLIITVVGSVLLVVRSFQSRRVTRKWLRILGYVGLVLFAGWVALIAWLKPFSAQEPALAAMQSGPTVTVTETATQVTMTPTTAVSDRGVFFQPGAKVDARAYAAVLRPLAEAGYPVIIAKQPLGIAFLATDAFESARDAHPEVASWIVGGHSLGGTVAAIDAEQHDQDPTAQVSALVLYASYPATDMSASLTAQVLSLSGTNDGLATPADIEASKANLPASAIFTPIEGAVHAFFGDYGPQPGDGAPTISHDQARQLITRNTLVFIAGADRASAT